MPFLGFRFTILTVLACGTFSANAQPSVAIPRVKIRVNNNTNDIRLVDKEGVLTFDQPGRKLSFQARRQAGKYSVEILYQDVVGIVFDESTHMRGGILADFIGAGITGGRLGDPVGLLRVSDYWMHISSRGPDGAIRTTMFEIPADSYDAAIARANENLSGRVSKATVHRGAEFKKSELSDVKSRHTVKLDWKIRPAPEIQSGKALMIVVCPPTAARSAGKGYPVRIHLDDRVVLVNKPGSYGFVSVEPGIHRLATQSGNANALQVDFEAGKTYYFLQDLFEKAGALSTISQHSKELVMHELSGAAYARWVRNPDPKK